MKERFLQRIYERQPMQAKKLERAFALEPRLSDELASFLMAYQPVFAREELDIIGLADAYVALVDDMLAARLEFVRTGQYPTATQAEAEALLYHNRPKMVRHLLGLAVSHFLWLHHYQLLAFYRHGLGQCDTAAHVLEIGSGHGLYTLQTLQRLPQWQQADIVDISAAALDITRSMLQALLPAAMDKLQFVQSDIALHRPWHPYDLITMGEVLEHVANPQQILEQLRPLLTPGGRLFITTCANSPSIDHIYQFHNIEEIRQMVYAAGYCIEAECVAPSEQKSPAWLEKYKADISYAAFLEVRTK